MRTSKSYRLFDGPTTINTGPHLISYRRRECDFDDCFALWMTVSIQRMMVLHINAQKKFFKHWRINKHYKTCFYWKKSFKKPFLQLWGLPILLWEWRESEKREGRHVYGVCDLLITSLLHVIISNVVLGFGPWSFLRTKFQSLVLYLALSLESLVLFLALKL